MGMRQAEGGKGVYRNDVRRVSMMQLMADVTKIAGSEEEHVGLVVGLMGGLIVMGQVDQNKVGL